MKRWNDLRRLGFIRGLYSEVDGGATPIIGQDLINPTPEAVAQYLNGYRLGHAHRCGEGA